jgi:hypothetical protein
MKPAGALEGSVGKLVSEGAIRERHTIVDRRTGRSRLLAGLESDIVKQRGFGEGGFGDISGVMDAFPPADEVEKVVGVDAQRSFSHPPDVLTIQETINPADLAAAGLFDNTNRALRIRRRLVNDAKLHH